jgi:putative ABC transport system permease protein
MSFDRFFARARGALALLTGRSRTADDAEMREEMQFHLDKKTDQNIAAGMTPTEARRLAAAAFGGVSQWVEEGRDEMRSRPLEDLARDLRFGCRALARSPGFALVAIVTLSLGIAAAATVFSFVDAIFTRRLPFPHADRLVRVCISRPSQDGRVRPCAMGFQAYDALRARTKVFDAVMLHYSTAPLYVSTGTNATEIVGAVVSDSYFATLGVRPALGRFFTAAEDAVPDRDFVVVIGHALWRSRFDGDPKIIGRTIGINGQPFTIIGVAPESFPGVGPSTNVNSLWIPMMTIHVGYRYCDALKPDCSTTAVMARLAPGVTLEKANAQLSAMSRELVAMENPRDSVSTVVAMPAQGLDPVRRVGLESLAKLLSAIAILLLVIACANLAGLLLARGLARQREIAVRLSLGAGRGRIVRQLLAENLVVALLGGALGVLLSLWSARVLGSLFSADTEGYAHYLDLAPNQRVIAFAAMTSAVTVIAFGLLPALETSRAGPATRLRGGSVISTARARLGLVALQTAMSLLLLIGAGLLLRSFRVVTSQQTLESSHVALMRLRPRLVRYDSARAQAYLREVTRRLEALPSVEGVAMARGIGLVWKATGTLPFRLPSDPVPTNESQVSSVDYHEISPRFFATLRVPVLSGREFTDRDDASAPRVAMVNKTLARRVSADSAVLGRTVVLGEKSFQIVGVVSDYRAHPVGQSPPPMAFVPFWQNNFEPQIDARLAVRVKGDAASAYPELRRTIASVDPAVPMTETLPMMEQINASYADVDVGGHVVFAAAVLALLLSGIGLYGVVAFLAERRTREVGVRLAVGAEPSAIVSLFLAQGMRPIGVGIVVGFGAALAAAKLLSRWLYGVPPTDVVSYAAGVGAVLSVAVLACYVPARRAGRIDPVTALRAE